MQVQRVAENPLLTPAMVAPSMEGYEIIGVFNAGVTRYREKTILLLRVAERPLPPDADHVAVPVFNPETGEIDTRILAKDDPMYDFSDARVIMAKSGQNYLTSISHVRYAESDDGIHFSVAKKAFIKAFDVYSNFGIEDPRITQIGDTYYISCSATSSLGIVTKLFATEDFQAVRHLGNIFHPDNKDITLFPEKIGGQYYAFHRPSTSEYGMPNIWMATSPDLVRWGDHQVLVTVREGMWDSRRIGGSCVPFLTEQGWLCIYHGATPENRYCLGALLLDKADPMKVLARSEKPLMEPEYPYELKGFFGQVIFSCGLAKEGEELTIYYGACDESICAAKVQVKDVLAHLRV